MAKGIGLPMKVPVPLLTWGACALSLAGVAVFAGDSLLTEPPQAPPKGLKKGVRALPVCL